MNCKSLQLTCGSTIQIYDNVFTCSERQGFFSFTINTNYKFGRTSSIATNAIRLGSFFSCFFTDDDDVNFSFNSKETVQKIVGDLKRTRSWINATVPGSWYYSHIDSIVPTTTLLYAINMNWDTEHGGEILFYNSYGEKEIAIDFIPGRIVKFDGRLMHKPAMTNGHFEPRYMYTCQY